MKSINKGDKFVCAACGEEFLSDWDAKNAQAQFEENFPDRAGEKADVVCQECYDQYWKWKKSGSKGRSIN